MVPAHLKVPVTSTPPPAALLALATHLDLAASHVAATDIVLVMPISQSECFAFFGGGSELLVVRLLKVDALPVEVLLEVVDDAGCFFFLLPFLFDVRRRLLFRLSTLHRTESVYLYSFGVLVAKLAELFVIALVIAVEIIAKIIVTIRMITANIQICIAIRHWHAVHAAGQTKSTPRRGAL